jgi:hypothetical protein
MTPEKLNERERLPITRTAHFARQGFSLRREGRGFAAWELRYRSPRIEALKSGLHPREQAEERETRG